MTENTDRSSLGGMDGEMNENTGSASLPGKYKYKLFSLWRYRCRGKKPPATHTHTLPVA